MNDSIVHQLLTDAQVIAVVGYSDKPYRTSYQIAHFLKQAGYKIYPVNPEVETIDGERSYASLADVPEPIDIVNVFRRSEYLPGVVDDAIAVKSKAIWAQLGVYDEAAGHKAESAGLVTVMNACIKVEYYRLMR
ncbi:MAG: CoA-binding protein [Chloroflexota bacterium]